MIGTIRGSRGGNLRNERTRFPQVEARRQRAAARQAAGAARTPAGRLAALDAAFGPGQGARRERAKLAALIEKAKTK